MTTEPTVPAEVTGTEAPRADSVVATVQQGPGRLIRLARERARMGLSDLAGLTKLAPATLEALERDDFSVLSEPVYVRGYYRKCAKALAVSEQELLAAYDKVVGPRSPKAVTKLLLGSSETGSSLKKSRRRSGSSWMVWLVAFIVLVAVAAWFLRDDAIGHHALGALVPMDAPSARNDTAAPSAEPADGARSLTTNDASSAAPDSGQSASQGANQGGSQSALPAAAPVQPSLATQLASPPPMTAAQPAAEPAAQSDAQSGAAPAEAGPDALQLSFKSPSWVRIEDSAGKLLLSGVIQAGEHPTVSGKPPYALFIGNAPGVTLLFQGKPVDISPFVKSNNTARLSVPASGD